MSTPAPLCPRCGYDQRGIIDAWTDHAPLRGLCSECGFAFEWADVLNPDRGRLPGLVEHSRGPRQLLRWTLTTFRWLVLPQRFWSIVQMHHAFHPGRILLAGFLVALLVHLATGLLGTIVVGQDLIASGVHVLGWRAAQEKIPLVVEAFLYPFATIYTFLGTIGWSHSIEWRVMHWIVPMSTLAACIGAWPLLFLVLPVTRREARLRWAHVWRATLYPLWWFTLLLVLLDLLRATHYVPLLFSAAGSFGPPSFLSAALATLVWTAAPIWIAAWWYFAIVRGWKLSRGRSLWFTLLVAAAVTAALVSVGAWYLHVLIDPLGSGTDAPDYPFLFGR